MLSGLAASWLVLAVLLWGARLEIAPTGPAAAIAFAWLLAAAATTWVLRNPCARAEQVARDAAEYFGIFVALALFGVLGSYAVAAQTLGYSDRYLALLDRSLGFDWIAWYGFVARHPGLQLAGRVAYQCIYVSPVALLAYYAGTGRKQEARRFIATVWVAAVLTLALFVVVPAEGPLAAVWRGPIPYMPVSALYQSELIPQLRSHGLGEIHLESLQGVICAPSFHAASGVLYIIAAWRAPPLRWPLLGINAAMLLSTPVEGTHYLVDILAGAAVAVVSVVLVRVLARRLAYRGRAAAPGLAVPLSGAAPADRRRR
jgi:membrane-associated phospholipid phosphatase